MPQGSVKERAEQVLAVAQELQEQGKTWMQANDALFSPNGLATILFPTKAERKKLAASPIHKKIVEILESLERTEEIDDVSGNFVVRVPRSLHQALKREAEDENVSMNQLVVAKLALNLNSSVLS